MLDGLIIAGIVILVGIMVSFISKWLTSRSI
jgi:hypothetical protein